MAVEVTKTMTIGELLQVAPQTAPLSWMPGFTG